MEFNDEVVHYPDWKPETNLGHSALTEQLGTVQCYLQLRRKDAREKV